MASRDVVLSLFENEIHNRLSRNPELYNRRFQKLAVNISCVLIFCQNDPGEFDRIFGPEDILARVMHKDKLAEEFEQFFDELPVTEVSDELFDTIIADMETTRSLRGSPFQGGILSSGDGLMSTFVRQSLSHTLKLDQTQRKISIQLPDGPQRVRGLAATGKTVVLSLKAALAHKNYPHFKILFVFNTQSMYRQVTQTTRAPEPVGRRSRCIPPLKRGVLAHELF